MNDFWHSFQGATLFLVLSHPDTYGYVSRLSKQPVGGLNLAIIHAVVFFIISLLLTRLYPKRAVTDKSKADVVSNSWWYKP